MNIVIVLIALAAFAAVFVLIGKGLGIRDLHANAGKRLSRAEHRRMGQLMDKAYGADDDDIDDR